jgi:hypothetical protein
MPVRTGVDEPAWDAFLARLAVTVLPLVVAPADPSCLQPPSACGELTERVTTTSR